MNTLRLTLRQLQIFVAVARLGTTAAAGREVSLSQSATSSAINELERLLSMRLFDRAGKRLLLNENGRALLPRALAQLDGAEGIERMASESGASAVLLRIGASTTIGNHVLPRFLGAYLQPQFESNSPAAGARVRIANTESICEAVAAFELDVGLIEGPARHAMLNEVPWLRDELVLVASTSFVPQGTARLNARQLARCTWLLREPGSGTREVTDQFLLPHLHRYARSVELGSSEALLEAAAAGLGVACLSRWVVKEALAHARLVELRSSLPRMLRQCYIVTHRQKQVTKAFERFMNLADGWRGQASA